MSEIKDGAYITCIFSKRLVLAPTLGDGILYHDFFSAVRINDVVPETYTLYNILIISNQYNSTSRYSVLVPEIFRFLSFKQYGHK